LIEKAFHQWAISSSGNFNNQPPAISLLSHFIHGPVHRSAISLTSHFIPWPFDQKGFS
jgi:hypothetical protein